MSITNLYNDPRSVTFLVTSGNQAVKNTAATSINNYATDSVNLADGQLGVLVRDAGSRMNTFLEDGELASEFKKIQLVQGTPFSANVSDVDAHRRGHQAYVKSNDIDASQGQISVISKPFTQSYSSAFILGDVAGNAGAFVPVNNVNYAFRIGFKGRKVQKRNSQAAVSRMFISIQKETTTYTNDVDRFLKRAAYNLNQNSALRSRGGVRRGSKPAIVFALNLAGGAGTSFTTIAGAALGSTFNYEVNNGQTLTFEVTADLKATLVKLIANTVAVGATTIEVINLSTAGSVAMGAGAAACDALMVLALDEEKAIVDDRIENNKAIINEIGLENFPTVLKVEGSTSYPGQGYGWQLYNEYQKRALMEIFAEETFPLENRPVSLPPYYFATDNTPYDVHEIWHTWVEYKDVQRIERANQIVIIVPSADTVTTGSMNTAGLAEWLNSVPNITKFTSATSPSIFV